MDPRRVAERIEESDVFDEDRPFVLKPTAGIQEEDEFFLSVTFWPEEDLSNDEVWDYAERLEEALPEFEATMAGALQEPPPPRGGGRHYAHIEARWND